MTRRFRLSWTTRWWGGTSKAVVSRLTVGGHALLTERACVRKTLPAGVLPETRAWVRTVETAHLSGSLRWARAWPSRRLGYNGAPPYGNSDFEPKGQRMSKRITARWTWLNFDIHGRLGIRVEAGAPPAAQLRTMFSCFEVAEEVRADIVVDSSAEHLDDAAALEDELAYAENGVTFLGDGVQIVHEAGRYRIHGTGELLTAVVPVLDRAMVEHGAAMIHAATVGYRGHAVALPAAGGTGKTSTVAKLMRREGFSFMGDDWAFLTDDGLLLGYEKPMFIKPHHRPIYPHLFHGIRRPLVPVALSRPVGRFTTLVHPWMVKHPKLAAISRRWSPEHRMVRAVDALPGVEVTREAPLLTSIFIERYDAAHSRLLERGQDWMVDRMVGNFHIEMAGFSREVVAALGATSIVPLRRNFEEKAAVLAKAHDGVPCYLLQIPSGFTPDQASDDVVRFLDSLLPDLITNARPAIRRTDTHARIMR